ncbi:nuclear transport factor 2 family protein [Dasania marina]|uniref:nuclear transport factor 2 family protein n=1 Tax=Dasania marina TaxID=471499 RepID=UPI000367E656|nr:nuclear transport factor 2 family protein [Dasania marina]
MSVEKTINALEKRLTALESEKEVRECMNRYMYLCDDIGIDFPLEKLTQLFSEGAVWEGKGGRYSKSFGRCEGRDAIAQMFKKYTLPPAHFELNVHVLGNEVINVDADSATGSWVLVQPSSFTSGKSQLSCARITAKFIKNNERWLIDHFQTESLFSRPMSEPWDQPALLPVPD